MQAENAAVASALGWWDQLRKDGRSRAASARLRRCAMPFDALLLEETHDLLKALRRSGWENTSLHADERIAALAMALAQIDESGRVRFAQALGRTADDRVPRDESDRPRLSPARFGALMRAAHARNWDAFARALRRSLAILSETTFYVPAFVSDVLYLNDAVLQRWTYDYWQTRAPIETPDQASDLSSTETDPVP